MRSTETRLGGEDDEQQQPDTAERPRGDQRLVMALRTRSRQRMGATVGPERMGLKATHGTTPLFPAHFCWGPVSEQDGTRPSAVSNR